MKLFSLFFFTSVIKYFFKRLLWKAQQKNSFLNDALISRTSLLCEDRKMKHESLQNLVKSKHNNGETPTKIFQDLNGAVSLSTVKRWLNIINETGELKSKNPPGKKCSTCTRKIIRKVKSLIKAKKTQLLKKNWPKALKYQRPVCKDYLQLILVAMFTRK